LASSFKKTHPLGVHPNVVCVLFDMHLRSVFRQFERKRLKKVEAASKLADKTHALELLSLLYASCSFEEARKKLKVTQGTLIFWRKIKLIETVTVLAEERIHLASVKAILSMPNFRPKNKRRIFNVGRYKDDHFQTREKVWKEVDRLRDKIEAQATARAEKKLNTELKKFKATEDQLRRQCA